MGFGSRAILAGGLGFTVAFVVACGNSTGLLSSAQKNELAGHLHDISSAVSAHDCARAESAASALNNSVAKLPQSVNPTLLQNLGQGAGTVSELAAQDCTPTTTTTTTTPTTTTTTTPTTTTTTPTTTTTTTPTTTTPTTTTTSPTTTATSPSPPGTTTTNGGVGVGGGTGTAGQGGNGQ